MHAILLFRLSLSRLLFRCLPRSFALSLALSLSPLLFRSLPRTFTLFRALSLSPSLILSLTHLLSKGDTSAYLVAKIVNGHYTKGDDDDVNDVNNNDDIS